MVDKTIMCNHLGAGEVRCCTTDFLCPPISVKTMILKHPQLQMVKDLLQPSEELPMGGEVQSNKDGKVHELHLVTTNIFIM